MTDRITLSTGTEVDANRGIVGIDAALDTYGGYDERIEYEVTEPGGRADLTPAERVELADLMIARWQAYRARWVRP